jgi:hypothetical protein
MDQWGTGGCEVRETVAGCRGIHECLSHILMGTAVGCLEGLTNLEPSERPAEGPALWRVRSPN